MVSKARNLDDLKIDRNQREPGPGRSGRWLGVGLFLLAAGLALAWWGFRTAPAVVRTVTAVETASDRAQTVLNASGYVTARRQATVSSKVTGRIVEVLIEEGMRVEENQVLARLDASNVVASLRLAEAQLSVAQTALAETKVLQDQADKDYRRMAELSKSRIASDSDLDRARSDWDALKARIERQNIEVTVAQRQVDLWQQQVEDMVIRAPFAGVVVSKNAQPGEMIASMSAGGSFIRTGICTIVDMSSLEIEVDVNESYINRVQPGQPVQATLDAYPDWLIPSRVIAVIPTADRQKATVKVRIEFEKLDPRLLPDMGVKVAFQETGAPAAGASAPRGGVSLPKTALRRIQGRDIVWVVAHDRIERRAVTLGPAGNDQVLVRAGLAPGERVVLEGPASLKEGDNVKEKKP